MVYQAWVQMQRLGPYELGPVLGDGGMATVFQAHGPPGNVALKRLHPHISERPEQVGLFRAEARLAERAEHPNLVRALDSGFADGCHYIAFELIEGVSLANRVTKTPLDPIAATHTIRQVLAGVEFLHQLGLVHCDVNPTNILCGQDGSVRLTDFGVATPVGATQTEVRGTYGYMAPEQVRGQPVDARTDVFAIGVVFWELCAQKRLFLRGAPHLTMAAVVEDPVPPLSSSELTGIAMGALSKEPEQRYPSCATFNAELQRIAGTPN